MLREWSCSRRRWDFHPVDSGDGDFITMANATPMAAAVSFSARPELVVGLLSPDMLSPVSVL